MSKEFILVSPPVILPSETLTTPMEVVPKLSTTQEAIPPEQVRAAEVVFTQEQMDRENHLVAGMLGLWSGAMLLHDLTVDHLPRPTDEELPSEKKPEEEDQP